MLWCLARRRMLIAKFRRVAMFSGPRPVRMRLASSAKTASRTCPVPPSGTVRPAAPWPELRHGWGRLVCCAVVRARVVGGTVPECSPSGPGPQP